MASRLIGITGVDSGRQGAERPPLVARTKAGERKARAMNMKERLKMHKRIENSNAMRLELWRIGVRRKRKAAGLFRGCAVSVRGWIA